MFFWVIACFWGFLVVFVFLVWVQVLGLVWFCFQGLEFIVGEDTGFELGQEFFVLLIGFVIFCLGVWILVIQGVGFGGLLGGRFQIVVFIFGLGFSWYFGDLFLGLMVVFGFQRVGEVLVVLQLYFSYIWYIVGFFYILWLLIDIFFLSLGCWVVSFILFLAIFL